MKKIIVFAMIIAISLSLASCRSEYSINDENLTANMIDDNYREYYEIFVGAFSDSNDDGVGDLQGVIDRLDYLNDGDPNSGESLGITGIWLMPIMDSPSYHKYDVADYYSIDGEYGTLDDFEELTTEAHARGINVIIDLVLNHTSEYNSWFREARRAVEDGDMDNPYIDYYTLVTEEEKVNGHTYYPFAGDLFYEGNFSSSMPELNMDNEDVKNEIIDIMAFWFDLGVDGFRLDATKYVYYGEPEKNIEFWNWFEVEATKIKSDAYIVGEVWSSDNEIIDYYESFSNFDFGMSQALGYVALTANSTYSVDQYVDYMIDYRSRVEAVRSDAILQPFISNHDMNRAAGYLSVEDYRMQIAANLYMLSYGTPFIYYGEEIGMKGSRSTENTDANRRLAMLWGDRDSVEDPLGATYDADKQTNGTVKDQLNDETSLYNHYKKLIMIRHANPEIARGAYTYLDFSDAFYIGGFLSTYENSTVMVLHNTGMEPITINLSDYTNLDFNTIRGYVGQGIATLEGNQLTLDGLTSVVLK